MNLEKFRIAWLRRDSVLFLDEKTGNRFEYPIPGQSLPGVPSYLRLANGTTKGGFVLTGAQLLEGLHLRPELFKHPWCIAVPCDLQNHEEAMLINFGLWALGAKRVILATFPTVMVPFPMKDIVFISDTFRSIAITYADLEGKLSQTFLPYEGFDQTALYRALDQLCPSRRPPIYVDDFDGTGRWNHLGTPVSLDEALSNLRVRIQGAK